MNTFRNQLEKAGTMTYTENGGCAYSTTGRAVYDLFALGGAMRNRTVDIIPMFRAAFNEDKNLALKCIFYLRDVRGGQGERSVFRAALRDIATNCDNSQLFTNLIPLIPEYGRFDDLIHITYNTPFFKSAVAYLAAQLLFDLRSKNPSLCAKWMPSENASSNETHKIANAIRIEMGMSHKEYRQLLSFLRGRLRVLERLMSANDWDAIDFAKLPAKAGLRYTKCFRNRSETRDRYEAFIASKNTKVNAGTLYPYEIVYKVRAHEDAATMQKFWDNLPDYFNGKSSNMICVVDSSGSMLSQISDNTRATAWDVAASLGIYTAERLGGPFRNSFITFSRRPKYVTFNTEKDIASKVSRMNRESLYEDTNLEGVFDLLYTTAKRPNVRKEDIPNTVVVISDMEINNMTRPCLDRNDASTMMENVRLQWARAGLPMPKLIYWNVMSRHNVFLDDADNNGVTYVSGCSPIIFKSVLTGKTGRDLMLEVLNGDRYKAVHF